MCGKKFSIYGVPIPRKCIESMHFYSWPSPPFKTPGRMFWKSVSPGGRAGGSYDFLYQNSVRKYEDDLKHYVYLHFAWFLIIINVMALPFCEKYISTSVVLKFVVSSLQPC